jgi:hypothetical protein
MHITNEVSDSYKTIDKILVFYISVSTSSDNLLEDKRNVQMDKYIALSDI